MPAMIFVGKICVASSIYGVSVSSVIPKEAYNSQECYNNVSKACNFGIRGLLALPSQVRCKNHDMRMLVLASLS
jgi:hypothetical protein